MNKEIKNDLKFGRPVFLYQRSNCLVVGRKKFVFVNLRWKKVLFAVENLECEMEEFSPSRLIDKYKSFNKRSKLSQWITLIHFARVLRCSQ